jgi:capsular polysaccharide biosynthesis protein
MQIYEPVTVQGIQWLRKRTGLRAHRGNRLIYVERRSSQTGRVGGCIEETDSFQEFIRKNGFERVDFGVGDTPLVDQVAMLDGARVILSAHGANLTNITYVAEGVSVIEVMPYYWTYFSHMQIASAVGLNYFGIVSHLVNEDQNCTLRMDVLEQAFQAALDAAPPVAMAHGKIFPAMAGATC